MPLLLKVELSFFSLKSRAPVINVKKRETRLQVSRRNREIKCPHIFIKLIGVNPFHSRKNQFLELF